MLLNQLPKPNGKEKDGRKGKVAAVIQNVKDFEKLQKLDFFNQCLQSPVRFLNPFLQVTITRAKKNLMFYTDVE
jgi:hypothetical protein